MYLHRSIEINLTKENASKLNKASKMFNRLKASLTGGMTPTEQRRSEIMLCVLQRVNNAMRASGINSLTEVSLNDEKIYYAAYGHKSDLKQSITSFIDSKEGGEVSSFKHLRMLVECKKQYIHYVFDISVMRNAPAGHAPVIINISGFINEFNQSSSQNSDQIKARVSHKLKNDLSTDKALNAYKSKHTLQFNTYTNILIDELNSLFPKGCINTTAKAHIIKSTQVNSLNEKLGNHFNSNTMYLNYWHSSDISYIDSGDTYQDMKDENLDYLEDLRYDIDNQSNWADLLSSDSDSSTSWFGDSSCSGDSSCGGGCGGD